jgi:hypothetical protein
MTPSIGPGFWPLSASACCTLRTVLESMLAALPWLMPLMPLPLVLLPERPMVDELVLSAPLMPLPERFVVALLLLSPRFMVELLLVVSPAARAEADASAMQQSAAAIGVRLNLISMLL